MASRVPADRANRAGRYAERRYARGLAAYRARVRLPIAFTFGPLLIAGLAGLLLTGRLLSWAAGVVFGAGIGAVLVLRETPPPYIDNWRLGAEGEHKTEQALRRLDRPRWLLLHDVESSYGNYDHVVVGQAGVYMLETKNLQGSVHMKRGIPYLRRRLDPEANTRSPWITTQAANGARRLHEQLASRTARSVWVHPVVVLWSDFDEGVYESERCTIVHGNRLLSWLSERPTALDRKTADAIGDAMEDLAAAAHERPAG
jgi:hypothetical protein